MEEDDEWLLGLKEEEVRNFGLNGEEVARPLSTSPFDRRGGRARENARITAILAAGFRGEKMSQVSTKNLLTVANTSVIDVGATYQMGQKFLAETSGDIFFGTIKRSLSAEDYGAKDIIDIIKKPLNKEARAFMNNSDSFTTINGEYNHMPVLIWVQINKEGNKRNRKKIYNVDAIDVTIEIMAHPDALEKLTTYIEGAFENEKMAQIKWWTQTGHGPSTREIYLPNSSAKILPEFYPDMADPVKYIADYLASDQSILLIAGPPGTGKTTLLRHMILDHKLSAHVVYDENLMQNDTVFQSFLFDMEDEIMIIEDADTILSSREREDNKMMSRFLNVSDGLIKLPNKKLVFTTNLTDFGRIDQALMRPGRCFGVIHTRTLNLTEAQAAAKVAGVPVPMDKREYTIAELFNQGKAQKVRGIGFVA